MKFSIALLAAAILAIGSDLFAVGWNSLILPDSVKQHPWQLLVIARGQNSVRGKMMKTARGEVKYSHYP